MHIFAKHSASQWVEIAHLRHPAPGPGPVGGRACAAVRSRRQSRAPARPARRGGHRHLQRHRRRHLLRPRHRRAARAATRRRCSACGWPAARSRSPARWPTPSSRRCGRTPAASTSTCATPTVRSPRSSPAGPRSSPGSPARSPRAPSRSPTTSRRFIPIAGGREAGRRRSRRSRSLTLIHVRGLGPGRLVQNTSPASRSRAIVVLIALGFAIGQGDAAHLAAGGPASRRCRGCSRSCR